MRWILQDSPGPMRLVDSAGSWEASRPVAGGVDARFKFLKVSSSLSSLPRETENTVYRLGYLTAISKLRLARGILTEQGEGS